MPNNPKNKIMVVDDTLSIRLLIEALLEDDFNVHCVDGGISALVAVNSFKPDIILLDVNMPYMDGYQVCQKLKENKATRDIPVIFISAEDGAEDQLKAYQMGGEGYITKPIDHKQLHAKIQERLRAKKELQRLEEDAKNAVTAAYEAMNSNSEMGILVRFMERSMTAKNYEALAQECINSLKEMGLIATIQIRNGFFQHTFSNSSESEIEGKLLLAAKEKGKLIEIQNRCIINANRISILIKNMPIENPLFYGRIKDSLAIFINSADNRIKSIGLEMQVQQERVDGLRSAIAEAKESLDHITEKAKRNSTLTKQTMGTLREDMEETLFGLSLSQRQEEKIMLMIESSMKEISEIANIGADVYEDISKISNRFHKLIENC